MKHLRVLLVAFGAFACSSWSVRGEETAKTPQYEDQAAGRSIAAASANEENIEFSAEKADSYLKRGALFWWAQKTWPGTARICLPSMPDARTSETWIQRRERKTSSCGV